MSRNYTHVFFLQVYLGSIGFIKIYKKNIILDYGLGIITYSLNAHIIFTSFIKKSSFECLQNKYGLVSVVIRSLKLELCIFYTLKAFIDDVEK